MIIIWKNANSIVAILALSGCAAPQVIDRYNTVSFQESEAPFEATISVFTIEPETDTASKTIATLSDRGQAAAIEALAARTKTAKELMAALAAPIKAKSEPTTSEDRTRIKRRLIASIQNKSPYPADRIASATIHMSLADTDAEFLSWNQFATAFESIDLGKMTFQSESGVKGGITLSAIPSSIGSGGSIDVNSQRTITQEFSGKERIVKSSGQLEAKSAAFLQEGAIGIDLTGNVVIDVELQLASGNAKVPHLLVSYNNLFDETGSISPAAKVDSNYVRGFHVAEACSLAVSLWLDYVIRHADANHYTIEEGDDTAVYFKGKSTMQKVIVYPADLMEFLSFRLETNDGSVLSRLHRGQRRGSVLFGDFESAQGTLDWLREAYGSMSHIDKVLIGPDLLYLPDRRITSDDLRDMVVVSQVENRCKNDVQ